MKQITIIDYGLGNLRSVQKGLEHAKASVNISIDPEDIENSDGVVLPGVGAFSDAMRNIEPFLDILYDYVESGKPLLGICLGHQMLMTNSEEGGMRDGLGFIPGNVVRFPHSKLKVPHMGWNSLHITQQHPIYEGIENDSYVYFVHSYYVSTDDGHTLASCEYGVEFAASVVNERGNVLGTQFHPEKSGEVGLRMLSNFVKMC
ncbi:imidazole glycerol phosphate synthase subunit HisH [Methanohalophilus sp. RSK]|uniref:imidazole glycerol phosphate synthase subunit HisH n=1 Tax=Methanohalophilus sp. RSK TaxID=2485783 RepID=UPI000F43C02E|nr:imidazole glycerol phosphate synthase subunit HisH [Methanohalophilus sp. RSK]RNI14150.1 imidazole glycerol phosphate synthase subunit HisH [Methanohalophilus sp. RSK]